MCFPYICGVLLSPSDKTPCVWLELDMKSAKEALSLVTVVCCSQNTRDFFNNWKLLLYGHLFSWIMMKNQVSVPSIFTTATQAKEVMKCKDNFYAFMWLLTVQGILPGGDIKGEFLPSFCLVLADPPLQTWDQEICSWVQSPFLWHLMPWSMESDSFCHPTATHKHRMKLAPAVLCSMK